LEPPMRSSVQYGTRIYISAKNPEKYEIKPK
jgi:hypothetical protein